MARVGGWPDRACVRALLAAALAALSGCGRPWQAPSSVRGPHWVAGHAELLDNASLRPGENFRVYPLERGSHSSLAIVSIRDRETPHVHDRYDLSVHLIAGEGTLWVQGVARPMRTGDSAFIPKGLPHYFVNESDEPAAALVTFAPAFDGPDVVPAPAREPDRGPGAQ